MYRMKEDRVISPRAFAALASSTLYERRYNQLHTARGQALIRCRFGPYFIEPVVAGLEDDGTPFIAAADLIGCLNFAKVSLHTLMDAVALIHLEQDFVVAGTASEKLFGMAEALWEPDMESDQLFEAISQSLLNVSAHTLQGIAAVNQSSCRR